VVIDVAAGRNSLQRCLKVGEEQRFVLVDGQAQSRVKGLKVETPVSQAGRADRVLESSCDVDEFSGSRGRDIESLG